jgi:hypothetical protein
MNKVMHVFIAPFTETENQKQEDKLISLTTFNGNLTTFHFACGKRRTCWAPKKPKKTSQSLFLDALPTTTPAKRS